MAFNRWDEFFGFNNGASNYLLGMNRDHNPIFHNQKTINLAKNGISRDEINRSESLQIDRTIPHRSNCRLHPFLHRGNRDRSFLCYLPFNAIHGPFQASRFV